VLANLGLDREGIRRAIEANAPEAGGSLPADALEFTLEARRALELAVAEAQRLGHEQVATEHLLLGLSRERTGIAAHVLAELGAWPKSVADETINVRANWPAFVDRELDW